ncbi:MAG TPA: hypothetical protein VE075_02855 [Thermoanaerobaculia bacterium]|nr:hypothetical protein [Thermoanaerobaculia bacterium]
MSEEGQEQRLAEGQPAMAGAAAGPPAEPRPLFELERRLREAGPEELLALVREQAPELSPAAALLALRNPYVSAEAIEELAAQPRLLAFYEVKRDLARCPATPEVLALRLIGGLFWADLVAIGLDTRLHPRLRRAADQYLLARLPGLAVGEKISIARRAAPTILVQLRHDPTPRVIAALLDNPRLTEGTLTPLVHGERTPAPVLELIAGDRRWGNRYPLRLALARNPATPLGTALRLLPALHKPDLRAVAADSRLAEPLRRRARLLLGDFRAEGV